MEPGPPLKPLITHTGEEFSAQMAAEAQSAPPPPPPPIEVPALEPLPKSASKRRRASRPANKFAVRGFLVLLGAIDAAVYVILIKNSPDPQPGDGLGRLFMLIGLILATGTIATVFAFQAAIALVLRLWGWPFWAVILGTVLGAPLLLAILLRLWLLSRLFHV